jgi:hypothetical protein
MLVQDLALEMENTVADALAPLAAELRLVDMGDYIAYLRMERFGCIADIVRNAAELYFAPGYVEFNMDGEATADWGAPLEVTLMLVIRGARANAHVALKLCEFHAEVKLGYIDITPEFSAEYDRALALENDIADNRLGWRARLPASGY